MITKPEASIIIPVKNEGNNVKNTVDSIMSNTKEAIEIIIVNDNSDDNCCSFLTDTIYEGIKLIKTAGVGAANARNIGASHAQSELLVFSDAHVFVPKNWLTKVLIDFANQAVDALVPAIGAADNPLNIGFGETWTKELNIKWFVQRPSALTLIPLAPGGFFIIRRSVFETIDGFDRGFRVWGKEDEEISLKLWLFGFQAYVDPEIKVLHIFRKAHPYPVTQEHVHYNFLRMAVSHFDQARINKVISLIKPYAHAENVISDVILSNAGLQREKYFKIRKYDADWFMKRFEIDF